MSKTLNKTTGYSVMLESPKKVGLKNYDEKELAPDEVRIKTLYSGISAGTELTAYRGSNPYLNKRWDTEKRVFHTDESSWAYPMPAFGYEEVGEIIELGSAVKELNKGDIIFGAWGHKSSHVAKAEWAKVRLLPKGLEPQCGIFAQIGSIALNAILDADIHVGETVAIFGQGVPGLMITQLAKANGAEVIAVDRLDSRLEHAKQCGADHVINGSNVDAAQTIKVLTDGRGADVSIEITGFYTALHEAIRATAYNSRVVVSGFFQGDGKGLFLGEEFHHNRIDLVCSQISGVNPKLDHRWNRLRLDHTIMKLQAQGKVDFKRLISHTFPAQQAQEAFALLDEKPAEALQVVLEFGDA
jgi:2-desacetyl-2-hydroxyethyl bacteriochlorophyllide A dehydrogenase